MCRSLRGLIEVMEGRNMSYKICREKPQEEFHLLETYQCLTTPSFQQGLARKTGTFTASPIGLNRSIFKRSIFRLASFHDHSFNSFHNIIALRHDRTPIPIPKGDFNESFQRLQQPTHCKSSHTRNHSCRQYRSRCATCGS